MKTNRISNIILDSKLDSKKGIGNIGRPKIRWITEVENDFKKTGARNRKQNEEDRTECLTTAIREVKGKLKMMMVMHWQFMHDWSD